MHEDLEDYWPVDPAPEEDPPLLNFLRDLARALQNKTNRTVLAEVRCDTIQDKVHYSLFLKAPHLGNYSFKVFYISHYIVFDAADPFPVDAQDSFGGEVVELDDLDALKKWVREVLSSDRVKAVINNMRRQNVSSQGS
jgi:hypothetical protein